jgi:hypothetical protein
VVEPSLLRRDERQDAVLREELSLGLTHPGEVSGVEATVFERRSQDEALRLRERQTLEAVRQLSHSLLRELDRGDVTCPELIHRLVHEAMHLGVRGWLERP